MSSFVNGTTCNVLIIGFVGSDPELSYSNNGTPMCRFSLATNKRVPNEPESRVEWHRIMTWGKLAETVKQYVTKGRKLMVQGDLRTRSWKDEKGTHYLTETHVSNFQFMDPKKEDASANEPENTELSPETEVNDDLPF